MGDALAGYGCKNRMSQPIYKRHKIQQAFSLIKLSLKTEPTVITFKNNQFRPGLAIILRAVNIILKEY